LNIPDIDEELARRVPHATLGKLASAGIRGETYFPTVLVLTAKPSLLGYYRLLYGYSQKQFYGAATGCSRLKPLEVRGTLSSDNAARLPELCNAFAVAGTILVEGLGSAIKTSTYSDDLCLLTFGAQLRGSANNTRGSDGIKALFAVLKTIFEGETQDSSDRSISIRNAVGRVVKIALASDPDILITLEMHQGERPVVAVEVKAGEDHSNIWNRVGEAEKSHLKARQNGVTECWTVINDPQAPIAQLRSSSPSTHRFYQLLELTNEDHPTRAEFASRLRSMVGL